MLVSEYRYLLALLQIKHDEMKKSE